MNHSRRNFVSRPKKLATRRGNARNTRRILGGMERLEDRRLLAGNLNPWHNIAEPLDVNGDSRVTPVDALATINELNAGGVRYLGDLLSAGQTAAASEGEQAVTMKVDVDNDLYLTPRDALQIVNSLNAEGEDPAYLVEMSVQVKTGDLGKLSVTPLNRQDVPADVAPGTTVIAEVHAKDIKTSYTVPNIPNYWGVYAAYADLEYDPDALVIPAGNSVEDSDWSASFPISYRNPYHYATSTDEQTYTVMCNFSNGPNATSSPGLVDEAGGFSVRMKPYGRFGNATDQEIFEDLHVFDIPFVVQSLFAKSHQTTVNENSSKTIAVTDLAGLIQGQQTITLNQADDAGHEILTWTSNGAGAGTTGDQGYKVPDDQVHFISGGFNVPVGNRKLVIQSASSDRVTIKSGGTELTYAAPPGSSGTDTFTVVVSDSQGKTKTSTVTVTVGQVNDPPVITLTNPAPVPEGTAEVTIPTVTVADSDVGGGTMTLTVDVTGGTVTLGNPGLLTYVEAESGTNDTHFVATGTLTQINAALAGTKFFPQSVDYNGTATITFDVNDQGNTGLGGAKSDTETMSITVTAVNDAPVNTAPTAQTVIETTPGSFAPPLSTTDVEALAEAKPVQVNLSVNNGKLNLGTQSGLTNVSGLGTGAVSFQGLLAAVNAALATLTYQANAFPQDPDKLTFTTSDLGTSPLPIMTHTSYVDITILPATKPAAVPDNYTVDEGSGAHTFNVLVNDINVDGVVGGGNLQITAVTQGSNGGTVAINGTSITYTRTGDFFSNPSPETFTYTVADATDPDAGDGPSTTTVYVTVNGINDSPTITAAPAGITTPEDTAFTFTGANMLAVADIDADFATTNPGVLVTLSVGHGTMAPGSTAKVTIGGQGTGTLTIAGKVADVNAALNNATYTPAQNWDQADSLQFTVDDRGNTGGGAASHTDTRAIPITITAVNDAPVNTVPASVSAAENATITFSGNISVADVDAGSSDITVTLVLGGVLGGKLNLTNTAGLTSITGNGSGSVTLVGARTAVNQALNGMVFTPGQDQEGTDTLTVTSHDNGATGAGGAKSDTDVVQIIISGINDPPVNTVPGDQTIAEDHDLVFSQANGNRISVADVDAGSADVRVQLSVTIGKLTLATTSNLTSVSGDGSGSITMLGSLANINTALNGMKYRPPQDFNTPDSVGNVRPVLTIVTNDQGHTGSEDPPVPRTDTDTLVITVTSDNDLPTAVDDYSAANPLLILENGSSGAINVRVNDSFAPDVNETLTIIRKTDGALGTVTISADGKTLTYTHTAGTGHLGPDSFTYTISDGNGGEATATVFVKVVNYVPSDLSGAVFYDFDNDGVRDPGDRGIGGVLVTLTGTDVQGNPVHEARRTDATGAYRFDDVLPTLAGTTYTLKQHQPSGMADGKDRVGDQGGTVSQNDQFSVFLPLFGYQPNPDGTAVLGVNNNFAEPGLLSAYSSIDLRDLLHSEQPGVSTLVSQGMLLGTDAAGNVQWYIPIGGWDGYVPGTDVAQDGTYESPIVGGKLQATKAAAGTVQATVHMFQPQDFRQIRTVSGADGNVTRVRGGIQDYAEVAGEGEDDSLAVAVESVGGEAETAQFAQAADAVFAGLGDLI